MNTLFALILFLLTCSTAHSLRVKDRSKDLAIEPKKYTTTLRKWLTSGNFNLAIAPQYNCQHTVFAVLEALKDAQLMEKLSGISAVSGGTVPAAFFSAGKSYSEMNEKFPKLGWGGFGPAEPKLTQDYRSFLSNSSLPDSFEKLRTPLAITTTSWDDMWSLKFMQTKHSHPLTVTSGNLHDAMVAAIATGNNGILSDPLCPYCLFGFHPKSLPNHSWVTDGGYTDLFGTQGLASLPKTSRVLQILTLDYPGQAEPQKPTEIPTHPHEVVSLTPIQTPFISYNYQLEQMKRTDVTKRTTKESNNLIYQTTYTAMKALLDQEIEMMDIDGDFLGKVVVDGVRDIQQTQSEKEYDKGLIPLRDLFWRKFGKSQSLKDSHDTGFLASAMDFLSENFGYVVFFVELAIIFAICYFLFSASICLCKITWKMVSRK